MTKKVLVIDDSPLMHRMYELALRAYPNHQIEPVCAADGHAGLQQLNEHGDVELIFLDVNMPSMSGLEFLNIVQGDEALRPIPVVLQSTEDHADDIARGLESGATAYLTKPFTPEQLHGVLDQILN